MRPTGAICTKSPSSAAALPAKPPLADDNEQLVISTRWPFEATDTLLLPPEGEDSTWN